MGPSSLGTQVCGPGAGFTVERAVSAGGRCVWWNRPVAEEPDSNERLASRTVGEAGPRVVFVHGLFGQGKNWTTIAKGLADRHRVTLIDLPNHGHSPWTDRVDYLDMA